ncbi:Aldo/keto reductase [Lindgomyces ingoldianus]|uniref:Aldo/keto reductase n=1 Tax=Lindgomyces ingoldianus TaxID=673940 RepID=A0ACB6QC14_9PLEO|nr:Aldo/keto reductase [Lindgomyces ingoldianus]KAF2463657.1 Aldo/keto reductase [Lindgomyces ingoldianus]
MATMPMIFQARMWVSVWTASELPTQIFTKRKVYQTDPELRIAIKEGGVPREKLFVTTKVLTNINDIENALKTSLKKLEAIQKIEFHPYLHHTALLDFHKKHGISTTAYGPLSAMTKTKLGLADDFLAALAKKYAVSECEISLRWCIDQDVFPITTSGKEQRLLDYLRAATFKLSPTEIKHLNELGQQKQYPGFWQAKFHDNDDRT